MFVLENLFKKLIDVLPERQLSSDELKKLACQIVGSVEDYLSHGPVLAGTNDHRVAVAVLNVPGIVLCRGNKDHSFCFRADRCLEERAWHELRVEVERAVSIASSVLELVA